jgi:hypothetical protein
LVIAHAPVRWWHCCASSHSIRWGYCSVEWWPESPEMHNDTFKLYEINMNINNL